MEECVMVKQPSKPPLYRELIDFKRVGFDSAIYQTLSGLERNEMVDLIMNLLKYSGQLHEEMFSIQYGMMRMSWCLK